MIQGRIFAPLLLLLAACGSTSETTVSPTYSSINTNIFKTSCLQCHSGSSASGDLNLDSYETLMASAYVVAGTPSASLLYIVLNSGEMPKGGTKLSTARLQAVSDWITAGGNND